jgi:hypothetical protein
VPQKQGERAISPELSNGIRDGLLERIAYYIAYLYIGLPVVIFVLGWIRWYIAVPLTAIILVSFFMCYLDKSRIPIVSERRVSRSTLTGMLLLVCVWAYLSGISLLIFRK